MIRSWMKRARWERGVARPPGPPSWRAPLNMLDFGADPFGWVTRASRRYGDFAYARVGPEPIYLVSHPRVIEQVLLSRHKLVIKDAFTRNLKKLLGNGLVTSEGDFWKRQRKIAAPALSRRHIAGYADDIVHYAHALGEDWAARAEAAGGRLEADLLHEMSRLTLQIVVKTLFGLELAERPGGFSFLDVGQAVETCLEFFRAEEQSLLRFAPKWLPLEARRRFEAASKLINDVFHALITERRANPDPDATDLLSRLLAAVDDDGNPMTDEQLRDEGVTMMLAGHETTSLALTFAFHYLSLTPDAESRLHDEIDRVLDGSDRPLSLADLESLTWTEAVIKEAMRILPPVWGIGREVVEPFELEGYTLPTGSQLFISQWILHRDPRWFREPLRFKPERWLDGSLDDLSRYAYLPFGGGPRVCIGNHFAMMEAILALATIARSARLRSLGPAELDVVPSVTTRPRHPMPFEIVAR